MFTRKRSSPPAAADLRRVAVSGDDLALSFGVRFAVEDQGVALDDAGEHQEAFVDGQRHGDGGDLTDDLIGTKRLLYIKR